MKFAVLGGDGRMAYVARMLRRDGHKVATYANSLVPELDRYTISEAVEDANCIILPLPAEKGKLLNTPYFCREVALSDVVSALSEDRLVLAGNAAELIGLTSERNITLVDYFRREELTIKNALITAEGAVQMLMEELPRTVFGMKVLVIGFGRIGKLTARILNALGANVTVSARKKEDMAWIESLGYSAVKTDDISSAVSDADAVINTVPAHVIGKRELDAMKKDCLIVDLASEPGGVDASLAESASIRYIWARSLPGKSSPYSAAEAICETVYDIISDREAEK